MRKSLFNLSLAAMLTLSLLPPVFAENSQNPTACSQQQCGFEFINQPIHKSPNDKADYRAIRLTNGMEVLLISDEKANKSLMSVGLPIGSMDDPIEQQGLAHYLEHMILMGSKRFPETNSLDRFLTQNGGYNNAYTAPDRTVYFIEVNHNAFDEAVDRLADSLAQPLLAETNANKEVNAVHAEMVRAKSNDGFLIQDVGLATANPAHPMTKFAVGNKVTLSDKPNSKLLPELRDFYQRYYSAGFSKAVLYSNQPIEQLAMLAARTLGTMKNLHIDVPSVDVPLLREQDKKLAVHYKPVKPQKLLVMSFDMPEDKAAFKQKSGEYLAYLFNNQSDGTLSDYLVKQGLSDNGVEAVSSADVSRNHGDFSLYIDLTEKGLKQQDKVISLVFQQIEKIKQSGIQPSYFNELKESLSQEFRHLQVEKGGMYIAGLAAQMLNYPLSHIIDQPYLMENLDENAIRAKLDRMTVDNLRLLVVNEHAKTDKKTRYFEAPYAVMPISDKQQQEWLNFSQNPAFNLPALNPYFATNFSITAQADIRQQPKLIEQSKGTALFAMQSRYFADEPKAKLGLEFIISPENDDLKQEITGSLLNAMNNLAQSKLSFQAGVAGVQADLSVGNNSLRISAEGYNQHLAKLVKDLLVNFSQFELTENALTQVKASYLEQLDRAENDTAARQVSVLRQLRNIPYFEPHKQREMVKQITLADIRAKRHQLLNQATGLVALSLGNLSDNQVRELVASLNSVIHYKNSAIDYGRYLDINQSQRKLNYIKTIPHQDNALFVGYFPNGYDEFGGQARALLTKEIVSSWYFDDLRTDKQLGYVVSAIHGRIGKTFGLQFLVQSPNASPQTIMQHNQRYFTESLDKLNGMSSDTFEKYKTSLLELLQHKPESLSQEFSDYLRDVERGNSKFDSRQLLIDEVSRLTLSDIVTFYRQAVIEQQGFVFAAQALGQNAAINQAAELNGFEKVDSIEQLQKTFKWVLY